MRRAWLALAAALAVPAAAFVFEIKNGTVNECGPMEITWSPGTPPYSILGMSDFDMAVPFDIPTDQIVEQNGLLSYKWTLPYDAGNRTMFIMSDATGFAAGGTSGIFTVGPRPAGANCTIRSVHLDMAFAMYPEENILPQCDELKFEFVTLFDNFTITFPITLVGAIPNGQVVLWNTTNVHAYWPVNAKAGNQLLFGAWDAKGNQAGMSALQSVSSSGDDSCLDENSPSPTPVQLPVAGQTVVNKVLSPAPRKTNTATPSTISGPPIATARPTDSSKGLSVGAIAGIAVGAGVAGLIALALLVFFCCCRKRKQKPGPNVDLYDAHYTPTPVPPNMAAYGGHRPSADASSPFMTPEASHPNSMSHLGSSYFGSSSQLAADPLLTPGSQARPMQYPMAGYAPQNSLSQLSSPHSPFFQQEVSPRPSMDPAMPWTSQPLLSQSRFTPTGNGGGYPPYSPHSPGASVPRVQRAPEPAGPIPGAAPAGPIPGAAPAVPPMAGGRSYPSVMEATKAAFLGPDHRVYDDGQPNFAPPSGGFRRHADAGSLSSLHSERNAPVGDLPPGYNAWDRKVDRLYPGPMPPPR